MAAKTFELTEYLVDILGVDDLGARFDGVVTYHDSCHLLRNLRIKEQPRRLLNRISGTEFVEMNDSDRCCGFGGSFSIKYADISAAMAEDKVHNIIASGADTVVGCDMGFSGCNIACAETGHILTVSNEGNIRMSTTMPRVHVAIMGMERVAARLEDHDILLRLLCRGAAA